MDSATPTHRFTPRATASTPPPATGKSASFLSRRYEQADSLGHDLADPDMVATLHDMGWFDGEPTAATAEAWNITSHHGTHEKEDIHRPAPEAAPPSQATATMPPQATPSVAPPAAPPNNAVIHEATRAGVSIILLVLVAALWHARTSSRTPKPWQWQSSLASGSQQSSFLYASGARWSSDDPHAQASASTVRIQNQSASMELGARSPQRTSCDRERRGPGSVHAIDGVCTRRGDNAHDPTRKSNSGTQSTDCNGTQHG
jgi:hypothetical protein